MKYKHKDLPQEEKEVKAGYGSDRYRNMTENEKNRYTEYQKKTIERQKEINIFRIA